MPMQFIAKTSLEKRPTHQYFWLCIFGMNRLHHLRTVHRRVFFAPAFQGNLEASLLRFATENSFSKLIRTRCRLATACVTEQFSSNVFGGHAFTKLCNGLEVSVAATRKTNIADFVAIAGELNRRSARTFSLENFVHLITYLTVVKHTMNIDYLQFS